MEKSRHNRSLVLRKSVVARALAVAFGAIAVAGGITTNAFAQSNTTGTIFGQMATGAGTSVVIENVGTGAKRTLTPDAGGRFQATALPPGQYKAQLMKGTTVVSTTEVEVLIGQGAEVQFAGSAALAAVQVVGVRKTIDVSSSNNGANFNAKQLEQLPIAKDIGAIIQLAPNTTRGDVRYNGAASFGGGSVAENSYYINGFPVTNPLTQLGSSQLPFGAISQAQILTGGFGAEFGRSIGGVMNVITKSGTNEWEGGVSYSVTPGSMRATPKDIYYAMTGDPENATTDGTLLFRRSQNTSQSNTVGAYLGGPIIKDKLFMFFAAETLDTNSSGVALGTDSIATGSVAKRGWYDRKDTTTRYLGKFDWNLTDNHHLELTLIGDQSKRAENLSGYNYATSLNNGVTVLTNSYKNDPLNANAATPVGMDDQILKYTGYLTEDLTLSALYGRAQSPHTSSHIVAGGGDISTIHGISLLTPTAAAPGLSYNNLQLLSGSNLSAPESSDDVTSKRIDLEWHLGKSTIKAGIDNNVMTSKNAGILTAGGGSYSYRFTSKPTTLKPLPGEDTVASGGGLGPLGYYGRESIFSSVTDVASDQQAQYVEERYQVTKDLFVTLGLRNESFQNKNERGETFLEQNNVLSPRFGAAWDVKGDSSLKVFGSAGRYNVQLPTALGVRGAGVSTLTRQSFTYTGINPDGSPIGRVNLGGVFSPDGELGQPKVAALLAATNLKPNQQDEFTIGFEKAVSRDLNLGSKLTYRKLLATIDDFCDPSVFYTYATKNGIDSSGFNPGVGSTPNCIYFNPGLANTFLVDWKGTGIPANYQPVTLSAMDMGFDPSLVGQPGPAKRTYTAIDVFAEHPLRNGWYGKVNYTWSRSVGNTEGQTLSDIGQGDVGETQAWDFGNLMEYAYGKLPNDRTHQIKAYGFYNLSNEWSVGANLLLASGRPRSCIGSYPVADVPGDSYGSAVHYCNGVPSPRGTAGNLPWDDRLDMNFVYKPEKVKGLALKVDVFNLFNKQTIQAVEETHNTAGYGSPIYPYYERVISYSNPRTFRLSAEYNYKF